MAATLHYDSDLSIQACNLGPTTGARSYPSTMSLLTNRAFSKWTAVPHLRVFDLASTPAESYLPFLLSLVRWSTPRRSTHPTEIRFSGNFCRSSAYSGHNDVRPPNDLMTQWTHQIRHRTKAAPNITIPRWLFDCRFVGAPLFLRRCLFLGSRSRTPNCR